MPQHWSWLRHCSSSSCTGLCGNYTSLCPDLGVEQCCHLVWYFLQGPPCLQPLQFPSWMSDTKNKRYLTSIPNRKESDWQFWALLTLNFLMDTWFKMGPHYNTQVHIWSVKRLGESCSIHLITKFSLSLDGTIGIQNSVVYFYSPLSSLVCVQGLLKGTFSWKQNNQTKWHFKINTPESP